MTDFERIINDLDGYMADHGFVRTYEYAAKHFVSDATVRSWVSKLYFESGDHVKVGSNSYIRLDAEKPTIRN